MKLESGEIVGGHYRLERAVGEGGMGIVWSAIDARSNARVALKVLKDEAREDPPTVRRFLREAKASMAVKHPNVVKIHEVVEADGLPIIVMDFLTGEPLAARLVQSIRLPVGECADIMIGVVSGIGTAHAAGIVHRDLKPDNIFLVKTPEGRDEALVVDFGIAKLTAIEGDVKHSGGLTTTGSIIGTPYYMSPEQVFGDKSIDHRTDVWSLGVILFECLAGRRPVDGDNLGQLLKAITTNQIPRLRDVQPGVPEDLLTLSERMLSFDRTRRPYDLREVLAILQRHSTRHVPSFGEATMPISGDVLSNLGASPTASTLPLSGGAVVPPPSSSARRDFESDPRAIANASGSPLTTGAAMARSASAPRPKKPWGVVGIFFALIVAGGVVFMVGTSIHTMTNAVKIKSVTSAVPSETASATPAPSASVAVATPSASVLDASVAIAVTPSATTSARPGGRGNVIVPTRPSATASAATVVPSAAPSVKPAGTGLVNDNPYGK